MHSNKKNNLPFSTSIIYTIIPIILFVITRIFGFDGLYGQDSYEYLRYANELFNSFKGGEQAGDYFWPIFYPLIGAFVNFVFNDMILTLGVINITALTITSIYIHKIIKLIYKRTNYLTYFIVVCFIFSPAIFRAGLVLMSDLLSACFIMISIYHYLKFNKNINIKSLYYVAIFGTCAIMTRYASFVILFPLAFSILFKLAQNKKLLLHILPILLIITILSFPHFYIKSENVSGFLNHNWLKEWSFFNFYKNDFITSDGSSYNRFSNIIYAFSNAFHPRYLSIGLLLIIVISTNKIKLKPNKTLLIAYVLYSLFLAGIPFQNSRFLILNFGLILILLFPVFEFILTKYSLHKKIINTGLAFLFLIQIFLSAYALYPFYVRNQLERSMVSLMSPYQNKTLYSFDIDIALKGRNLDFDYKNLWQKKYHTFNNKDLVLFNSEKFKQQWKGKNPMLNWENIIRNYHLKVIESTDEGWNLYEIQNKKTVK